MTTLDYFYDLFQGRTDAYGTLKGGVVREELTKYEYESHLAGNYSIGVFPMMDDNRVWFGAIDLDEPNFKLAHLLQRMLLGEAFIERSRSGNAHVWVFFDAPCPAWAVRAVLRNATEAVGRPEVEVFPKQDRLREGMVGNYINLPYFGEDRPFVEVEEETSTAVAYLSHYGIDRAYHARQEPDEWVKRARLVGGKPPEEREATAEWGTQPVLHECAAYIIENREKNPLQRGSRHVVLFNVAKQLLNWREVSQTEAYRWLQDLNDAAEAPVAETELRRLFDNAREGRWTSTGCDEPQMLPYVHPDCPIAHG
jgi:hypothetical protein